MQSEISGVIEESRQALSGLCGFFDEIKDQYQTVVKHIDRASRLGTMKSAMLEDMDNLNKTFEKFRVLIFVEKIQRAKEKNTGRYNY